MARELNEQWVEVIDGQKHMFKAVTPIINGHPDIKDLGILNDDGCLPSPWGRYPKIVRVGSERFCTYKVRFYLNHEGVYGSTLVEVTGNTRQEAIDAWNRRT